MMKELHLTAMIRFTALVAALVFCQFALVSSAVAQGRAPQGDRQTTPQVGTQLPDDGVEVLPNAAGTVTVLSPNGGETWTMGQEIEIEWTSENVSADFRIDLYRGNGVLVDKLWRTYDSGGSLTWMVRSDLDPGSDYYIQISSFDDPDVTDTSDGDFTIQSGTGPQITPTYPDGGEELFVGEEVEIEWTSQFVSGDVEIRLYQGYAENGRTIAEDTPNDGSYTWTVPSDLIPGDEYYIFISSRENGSVWGDTDFFELNYSDTETLALSMTARPDPVRPGQHITYEMTITNRSSQDVAGVTLRNRVPNYVENIDGDEVGADCDFSCQPGELMTWDLGTLPAGASRTAVYAAKVLSGNEAPADGSVLSSRAVVSAGASVGATSTTDVLVDATPALTLGVVEDREPVRPGQTLTYRLTYANPGPVSLSSVTLQAPLPLGVSFVSASDGGQVSNGAVEWNLGTVGPGGSGQRTFTVSANSDLDTGHILEIQAEVSDGQETARAVAATVVQSDPQLALSMTARPDPVRPGQHVTYEMTVTNRSSQDVAGVELRNTVPGYVENIDEDEVGGDCHFSCQPGETMFWSLGTLPAGESRTVVYAAQVRSGNEAPPNNALIGSSATAFAGDGVGASASADVLVDAEPHLALSMTEDRDPVAPAEALTYTLVYANPGAVSLSDVTLRVQLPEGTSFQSASGGGVIEDGIIEWELDELSIDETGLRSFTVNADPSAEDEPVLVGQAKISSSESAQSVAQALTATGVQSDAPLSLSMTTGLPSVQPGGHISYEMTVTNRSGQVLTGVELRNTMPGYVEHIDEDEVGADCHFSCNPGETMFWTLGTLQAGESHTVVYAAQVWSGNEAPENGTLINSSATVFAENRGGATASVDVVVGSTPNPPPPALSPPTLVVPGTSDPDNPEIVETLTPTFHWEEVPEADRYGLYVSERPFGSENIIYSKENLTGDSHTIPSGELEAGVDYRWNMVSIAGGEESAVSNTLYFTTQGGFIPVEIIALDGPAELDVGEEGTFTATVNEEEATPPLTYEWDFGDGTTATTDLLATHNYDESGTYTIAFTASNEGSTDSRSMTVTVGEVPAAVSFMWPVENAHISQPYAEYDGPTPNAYHSGTDVYNEAIFNDEGLYGYSTLVRSAGAGVVHKIFGLKASGSVSYDNNLRRWNSEANEYTWGPAPTSGSNHGLGIAIIIYHPSTKIYTLYGHLDAVVSDLSEGQSVEKGSIIGRMGNSHQQYLRRCPNSISPCPPAPDAPSGTVDSNGGGFGPHVHFEVKDRGVLGGGTTDDEGPWGYTPVNINSWAPPETTPNKPGHPNWFGYHNPKTFVDHAVQLLPVPAPVEVQVAPLNVRYYPDERTNDILTSIEQRDDGRHPAFVAVRSIGDKWYQVHLPNKEREGWSTSGWIAGTLDGTQYAEINSSLPQVQVVPQSVRICAEPAACDPDDPAFQNSTIALAYGEELKIPQRFVTFGTPEDGPGSSRPWYKVYLPANANRNEGWISGDNVAKVGAPPGPAEFTATVGDGKVTLRWTASDIPNLTSYKLYRDIDPTFAASTLAISTSVELLATLEVNVTSYVDSEVGPGTTYYYRLTAVDEAGNETALASASEANAFLYPATMDVSISQSFGDPTDDRNYRLVALPGDASVSVASTLEGTAGEDWRVFYDNGQPEDYLVEHDGSARFQFAPGRGFWMLSESTWSHGGETETVTLSEDGTYAIDLHDGWNVISNPFGEHVDWPAVQEANGGLTQALWQWNGSYDEASAFASAQSGEAYYFFNESGLSDLKLPYPQAASPDEAVRAAGRRAAIPVLMLRASVAGDTLASQVAVGLAPDAKEGFDAYDQYAPPGAFAPVGFHLAASFRAESGHNRLAAEYRPDGQGQAFDFILRAEPDAPVRITASGLSAFAGQEVVLVGRRTARRYDLRRQPALRVRPETEKTRYALLVGSPAYVEHAAAEIIPEQTKLLGNYPNPFVGRTTIAYTMAEPAKVRLTVYDVLGRRVAVLVDEEQEAGRKEIPFEARGLASGLYVYRLRVGDYVETGKLVLVR